MVAQLDGPQDRPFSWITVPQRLAWPAAVSTGGGRWNVLRSRNQIVKNFRPGARNDILAYASQTHPRRLRRSDALPLLQGRRRRSGVYKTAFGAKELHRMPMPDGKVGHAEMQIGGARVMLSDEFPEWGNLSPLSIGGSATTVLIYFEDVDAVVDRAVSAGAKLSNRRRTSSGETKLQLQDISGHVDVLQPARKTSPKR